MTHLSFSSSRRSAGFGASILGLYADATRAWRHRQAARAMAEMSDAMLHDVGVTRGEIEHVTRFGRSSRG